ILISTVFFGYKVGGVLGALAAAGGIFIPSSLLMIFCSHFYERISHNGRLKAALTGIKPAIVGLILYSGASLLLSDRLFDNRLYLALLTAVGIVLLEGFKWSTLRLALAGFGGGIIFLFIHNL
ncbi:MAG: chromate transporter, partial [Bacteroidota bacterium]